MNHYINTKNQIFGLDDSQSTLVTSDMVRIPLKYTPDMFAYLALENSVITFNQAAYSAALQATAISQYKVAAQTQLDSVAQAWGYDSLVSAASYASSSNTKFKAEGIALINWRDSYWSQAYVIEAAIVEGRQAMPATAIAFASLLPAAPIRPQV